MAQGEYEAGAGAAEPTALRRAAAFSVHIFTALGAGLALLALLAAVERHWAAMFAWLGVALIVDGIDGTFARRLDVRRTVPRWSGDTLDMVVDILTYVFVPAYALTAGGLLPPTAAVAAGLLVVCTGVLYFADTHMKTPDNYFLGFPGLWNLVVFYLFLLRPPQWAALCAVVILAALTFVPLPFAHPVRVQRGRVLNYVLLATWCGLAVVAVAADLAPPPWVAWALAAIGLYYLLAGFRRNSAQT